MNDPQVRPTADSTENYQPFELRSRDGVRIDGQVDLPTEANGTAVIFASGSGLFDRDCMLGISGTPRDRMFKDLGARLTARGVMAVRHDRRGVRYPMTGPESIDSALTITATTQAQVDDLRAVYDWTRASDGLAAHRVVFLVHSEGTLHLGRLALSGAPAPAAVIGIGSLMESPKAVLHWQMVERVAEAIASMDSDGDGVTTNDDVRARWESTPAAAYGLEALLSPTGSWSAAELERLTAKYEAEYQAEMNRALAAPDDSPYPPTGEVVAGPNQWYRTWFTDDTPNAVNLALWSTSFRLHYGTIDAQTAGPRQLAAARAALPASSLHITMHENVGHSLGHHTVAGPMLERIADLIADEAASVR